MVVKNLENNAICSKDLNFPSWRAIMTNLLELDSNSQKSSYNLNHEQFNETLSYLDFVASSLKSRPIEELVSLFANQELGEPLGDTISRYINRFKSGVIAKNQFYSVYDIQSGNFLEVDPQVEKALGLNVADFSLPAMLGLDPKNRLYHPNDLNHMIRWAGLAYFIFDLPVFDWETADIYYCVSFKVSTAKSSLEKLRNAEYVALEKRCYPLVGIDSKGAKKPICHFDQWSVIDASSCQYVTPKWVISGEHSGFINQLFYLFNAYILNMPVKHLLMLHEKMQFDRNKAIALSLNEQFMKYASILTDFDEVQVGNAFSKTIRPKVEILFNQWDKRTRYNAASVISDQDAVHRARALGLLPIPPEIISLIYRLVS
ncbi:MAG: hypothetical protein K1X54_12680 [Flavobacteriales bacterium]|nr:hypothetical protein [Flavobacteriales bacterium]